jgi:hypothetical protein
MATLPEIPKIDAIFVFFQRKGTILISNLDSRLNFERRISFCPHLSLIVFDLCHLFRKKSGLQGFIKKRITSEHLEIHK